MNTIYRSVGCVANDGETTKDDKYQEEAGRLQFRLQPAGCETYGALGAGMVQLIDDIAKHAGADGTADTRTVMGWGAPHVREFAWQAVAVGRIRGIAAALERSAWRRRQAHGYRAASQPAGPSAALQRSVGRCGAAAVRRRRAAVQTRRGMLAATHNDDVLSLPALQVSPSFLSPSPALIAAALPSPPALPSLAVPVATPTAAPACLAVQPALLAPAPIVFESNPGDELDFVSEGIVLETQRDGEGPSSVAHVPPRRRANTSSSGVLARCRGRSFLLALVVAGLVVLLALLVLCVVVANRELAALGGRVVALEAGGLSAHLEVDGVAATDFGFRRCSECSARFFV